MASSNCQRKSQIMSREEQKAYTDIFMNLDTDRNGWLSREEIGAWLRGAGYQLTEQQIESVFRIIDTNADGKITLDEFYVAMDLFKKPPNRTNELHKVFKAMDKNGDGFLSESELFDGLNNCGYRLSRQQVKKFIANLDTNNDGQISFEEFLAAFN